MARVARARNAAGAPAAGFIRSSMLIGSYLAFPGRIEREDWVGQAKTLSTGGETEFAMRAKAGLVETSRDDGSAGQDNVAELVTDGDAAAGKPEDKPAP